MSMFPDQDKSKELLEQTISALTSAIPGAGVAEALGRTFGLPTLGSLASNSAFGDKEPTVGTGKRDPEKGLVFYAGKNYGFQTPESYKKIHGGLPSWYESASQRQSESAGSSDSDAAASTAADGEPDWTQGTGGAEGQAPPPATLPGSTTPPIPQSSVDFGPLRDLIKDLEEKRGEYIEQDLGSALQRMLVTNMLSMRQTRENTKRQVELKNIEAWQNIERARIEANARQAALLAQTAYLSQIPNAGVMAAMTKASEVAMAPFVDFKLT